MKGEEMTVAKHGTPPSSGPLAELGWTEGWGRWGGSGGHLLSDAQLWLQPLATWQ